MSGWHSRTPKPAEREDRHNLHPWLLDAPGHEKVSKAVVHPLPGRVLAARDLGGGHDGEQPRSCRSLMARTVLSKTPAPRILSFFFRAVSSRSTRIESE